MNINTKRCANRHIMTKTLKAKGKEKISKAVKEKWLITHRRALVRLVVDFPSETKLRLAGNEITNPKCYNNNSNKNMNPISSKTIFQMLRWNKDIPDKPNWKNFIVRSWLTRLWRLAVPKIWGVSQKAGDSGELMV